jgi:hypothetical protein
VEFHAGLEPRTVGFNVTPLLVQVLVNKSMPTITRDPLGDPSAGARGAAGAGVPQPEYRDTPIGYKV